MIAGIFFEGSGLGDQLFRYITVRTLAEEKEYMFGMQNPENFKGNEFMNLNMGVDLYPMPNHYYNEKDVRQHQDFPNESIDIRSYDPEINFVEDNTILDGSFEDSKYWHHNLESISKWLAVEPLNVPDWKCLVGFRGGEYAANPDLFLTKDYYEKAIKLIPEFAKKEFEIHTDDPHMAMDFFGSFDGGFSFVENEYISHSKHKNMDINWRSTRYAKYAIIPNSAFFILPRLLKHLEDPTAITIAPRYWARRNTKVWARPACYYKEFTYI